MSGYVERRKAMKQTAAKQVVRQEKKFLYGKGKKKKRTK